MKRIFSYSLLGLLLIASSCGNKGTKTTNDQSAASKAADNQMMTSHTKKYGIKSGIITFSNETNLMAETNVKKVYFDDYGAKEASEVYRKDKLTEKHINKADGYVYILNIDKNNGSRSKHAMASGTEMKFDFSNGAIPENIKKQYHFEKLPNETICGKDCEVYTTDYEKMKARYAGWNGILLMIETSMPMGSTTMTTKSVATKIEENVAIPETVWEVPAGIQLIDQ